MTPAICAACWHSDRADRIRVTRQGDPYFAPALEGALRAAREEPHVPAPNCHLGPDDGDRGGEMAWNPYI